MFLLQLLLIVDSQLQVSHPVDLLLQFSNLVLPFLVTLMLLTLQMIELLVLTILDLLEMAISDV